MIDVEWLENMYDQRADMQKFRTVDTVISIQNSPLASGFESECVICVFACGYYIHNE